MKLTKLSALGLAMLTLAGCKPATEHRTKNPMVVDTYTVSTPIESQYRNFNGQVMPAELTPLAFRLDGELAGIMVQEGDSVTKGQVVAMLDDSKLRQGLSDAQARYELALKQFKRGEELHANTMISKAELDELRASYKLAKANLGSAQSRMSYTRLKAPFDGVISSVIKKKHEAVTPGETIVSIYQDNNVYVKVSVSDSVLAMLKPETRSERYQPVATFAGHQGRYPMSYLEHTSELHPQSQTYEFWLSMPQIDQSVLPGTSAKVSVDLIEAGLNMAEGFQLPMTAIEAGASSQDFYVWKLEGGKAHRYEINVDQINGTGALVSSGIKQGDVLVSSSLRKLREGMEIKGAQL